MPGLDRGYPAGLPPRTPVRESAQLASAWAALTLPVSNTSADTSLRHGNPRTTLPASSTATGAFGARPSFQALISLMNDTFDHDNDGVSPASGTS